MAFQTVFRRYELKYLLTKAQKAAVLDAIAPYMQPDAYGRTTIRNLYLDTEDYRLIRRSLDAPVYKEKLRVRSYAQAADGTTVFVELKKKYESVVYKRRLPMCETDAMQWLCAGDRHIGDSQIANEIEYVLHYYGSMRPAVFLSYEREAYYQKDDHDFRVTFDDTILCRQDRLSLREEPSGTAILPEDMCLMEIKCAGGIPMWMVRVLSENKIRKTSFSKYGRAYQQMILPEIQKKRMEEYHYA